MKKKIYSLLALCLLSFGMAQAAEIDPSQDIDRIVNRQSSNRKFIHDGQLLIESNGKTFNAQGAKIQ